jgi:hypothetical protein
LARIGLRKEQIKSILLCKDREFKRKSIGFLNNSAFAAEKFGVEQMTDALEILERDLDIENFVFDASPFKSDELRTALDLYQRRAKNPDIRFLIYLDESYQAKEKDIVLQFLPKASIYFLPPAQNHFNKAFHGGRAVPDAPASTEAAKQDGKQLTLIETSSHIKETVDLLNSVSKDKSRLDILQNIGQRFNGIIGTFSFFGQKGGYGKVKDMATIIDDISRTYEQSENSKEITEKHWQILKESATTLYLILKDLRESRQVTQSYIDKANALTAVYQQDNDIRKRASQSQDEVDRILDVAAEIFKHSS